MRAYCVARIPVARAGRRRRAIRTRCVGTEPARRATAIRRVALGRPAAWAASVRLTADSAVYARVSRRAAHVRLGLIEREFTLAGRHHRAVLHAVSWTYTTLLRVAPCASR